MKVVALHTDFRLYWPARFEALSEALSHSGHELIVIEIAGKGSPYAFADNNKTSKKEYWIQLFPDEKIEDLQPKLAKKVIKEKLDEIMPDVVVAGAFAFTSGATAIEWTKANDKAIVIFDDSKKENVPRAWFVNLFKRIYYFYTDAIFCPAEDWLDTFVYWGFKKQAVFFGENVVDNKFWSQQIDKELPFQLPNRYLLCVGRQVYRKNFHTAINAFIQFKIQNFHSDLNLVLVGEGPERPILTELVPEELTQSVHFIPFLEADTLRVVYQQALAFILPSYLEQWGLVVNEAMACGLPVIVSQQCGCSKSLVRNRVNGYVVDANDVNDFVTAIKKINQSTDDEIQQMKTKSTEIVSHWGLDRFCKGVTDAIHYAVSHKKNSYYFILKYILRIWNGRYNPA